MTDQNPRTSGTSGTSGSYDGRPEVRHRQFTCPVCKANRKVYTKTGNLLPYCRECWNRYYRDLRRRRAGRM